MSEECTRISPSDLDSCITRVLGYNTERMGKALGLNPMASCSLKTLQESLSARSSSPTPQMLGIKSNFSTGLSSSISLDEADAACAQLKSLDGTIARLRSQLDRELNEAYWQHLQRTSRSTPSSIETQ
jgi:hypothetical protein